MKLTGLSSATVKVFAISLTLAAVMMTVPTSSNAGTFPKLVYGYVWDAAGTPLEDADVTVNIKRPDTTIRSTLTDTTLSGGDYMVSFSQEDWEIGDTIEVISTYHGNQESNTTDPISAEGPQMVNISYAFEIPEFGSSAGILITGALLGAVAVVTLVYFRKR